MTITCLASIAHTFARRALAYILIIAGATVRLGRSSAWLCVIGLGLVTSCIADSDAQPSDLTMDRVADGAIPTAAACTNPGGKRCFAHVQATAEGHLRAFDTPAGFAPADLQAAYQIPVAIAGHPTIGLIDAYGYDALESDLAMYRSQFGLPPCTTANGCLKIVNQNGDPSPLPGPPPAGNDWTLETALDVDMASAACPSCYLLVVQADDDKGNGLELGQGVAAQQGAAVISNSWGGPEQQGVSLDAEETYFDQPVAVFVAAGDNGYDDGGAGPDYPGTSAHTIAVGGTTLQKDSSARGWTETAWALGGSACSLSIAKPAYQSNTSCSFKATTDIAAVGDPQTGMAAFDSKNGGWGVVGGTSAATPLVAGIFAATGNGDKISGGFIMQNAAKLNDVTGGANGTCGGGILCNAGPGWDGPTGYGTPNGKLLTNGGASPDGQSDPYGVVNGGCNAGTGPTGWLPLVLAIGLVIGLVPIRRRARG